ncbi:hypothetical protein [Kitasatospora terrestris]|uniref:Uncharacterized protein n=1 Tax=Kitasatospora terrestris TaxID=258051 RepID=A0ABP9D9V9_9ACTN
MAAERAADVRVGSRGTGPATLVGFDSAADLAEEAKDSHRSVPRAIAEPVVAASVLGLLFLTTLTVAIEDVPRISGDGSPVAAIIHDHLDGAAERVLLVLITFAGLLTFYRESLTTEPGGRDAFGD